MTPLFGLTTGQWIIIGLAAAITLAGLGLILINVLSIIRPRKAGESGPPRKLVGRPQQVTRRRFFGRMLGTAFGISMTQFGVASIAFLWPSLGGGFGGVVTPPDNVDAIKERIRENKRPYYYGPGRFYLVEYDEANDPDGLYTKPVATAGGATLVAEGLMALYQRCVHLGCRVPFCETSQWFECPCHGSKYNYVGEFKDGPAPRGLDRFPVKVENGVLKVDTGNVVIGPSRGTDTSGQKAQGPFCVNIG